MFFSCSNVEKTNITFSGQVKNTDEAIVKVSNYNSTLKAEIDIDSLGYFSGSFKIDKKGYYYFQIGRS